mgnify:FL=1
MYLEMFLGAVAGLSLFLYGMKLMADGLQKFAGDKLKSIVRTLTKNRLMAVLVGMFVTTVIQSSSATSVMVVGFVNAGIMTIQQAVGVIFGANIGTTITGQMVSFNLSQWAPIAIGTGILMGTLVKNPKLKEFAEILVGFGILFIGMNYLKDALAPLKDLPAFTEWIVNYGHNPLFGVALGFIMTLALQSSSATIGVLIALASQGVLPFATALYIIFGDNIGTCTTALISSLGTSRRGKQVAVIHLSINIIGTIYFMLFLTGILTNIVTSMNATDIARQIANAHTIFNIVNVIVLFPFANLLVKLADFIIPEPQAETMEEEEKLVSYLDKRILVTPSIALQNTMYEFAAMSHAADKTLTYAIDAIRLRSQEKIEKAFASEKKVNQFQKAIIEYLVEISQQNVSIADQETIDELFSTVNDVERISDHAENIADFAKAVLERDIVLDEKTLSELEHVFELVQNGFAMSIDTLSTGNIEKVKEVITIEREIDRLKIEIRDKYMKRMNKGIASADSGIFVMDLLSNLERISDHFRNIGETVQRLGRPVVVTE